MKDILPILQRWTAERHRVAVAMVTRVERSAPREPGAMIALSETGAVAGSVTGGCVEPAVLDEAAKVLDGAPAKVLSYGIADEDGLNVGLPCGGTVQILVATLDPAVVEPVAEAVADERHIGLAVARDGSMRLVGLDDPALGPSTSSSDQR